MVLAALLFVLPLAVVPTAANSVLIKETFATWAGLAAAASLLVTWVYELRRRAAKADVIPRRAPAQADVIPRRGALQADVTQRRNVLQTDVTQQRGALQAGVPGKHAAPQTGGAHRRPGVGTILFTLCLIGYAGSWVVSALRSPFPAAAGGELPRFLASFALFWLAASVARKGRDTGFVISALLASSSLTLGWAVLQVAGVDPFFALEIFKGRVFASMGNPNFLASLIVLVYPLALSRALGPPEQRATARPAIARVPIARATSLGIAVLAPPVLYLTGSVSGAIGFIASLAVFSGTALLVHGRKATPGRTNLGRADSGHSTRVNDPRNRFPLPPVLWIGAGALLVATVLLAATAGWAGLAGRVGEFAPRWFDRSMATGSTNPVANRLNIWTAGAAMIRESPWTGHGPASFELLFPSHRPAAFHIGGFGHSTDHAHNEFLEVGEELGLPGLVCFLGAAGVWLVLVAGSGRLGLPLAAGMAGFLVQSAFCVSFRFTSWPFFWLVLGIGWGIARGRSSAGDGPGAVTRAHDGSEALTRPDDESETVTRSDDGLEAMPRADDGSKPVTRAGDGLEAMPRADDGSKPVTRAGDGRAGAVRSLSRSEAAAPRSRALFWTVFVVSAVALAPFLTPRLRADMRLASARREAGSGRTQDAVRLYRSVIDANPRAYSAYYEMAFLQTEKLDRQADALATYHALAAMAPDYAQIHFNLGVVEGRLGHKAEALAQLRKAVLLDPFLRAARIQLARAESDAGHPGESRRHLGTLLGQDPDDIEAREQLVLIAFEAKDWASMIEQCVAIRARRPDDRGNLDNLAVAYGSAGREDEALAMFTTLIVSDSSDPVAHRNFGIFLLSRHRDLDAVREFREALRIDPSDAAARAALAGR